MTKQADLMTVREAAVEMGCTIPYMYLLLHGRRIEGQQTEDGRWLIPADAVRAYKASHPRIGAARRQVLEIDFIDGTIKPLGS